MDSNHFSDNTINLSSIGNSSNLDLSINDSDTFQVANFVPTASGFEMYFNQQLENAVIEIDYLNLENSNLMVRDSSGALIRGSVVFNEELTGFTFVKTGDSLAPENYTVTLKSGAEGFTIDDGIELDGNGDGTVGDNYVIEFTVDNPERVINLSDIVLLPGETIENEKLSVSINDGANVTDLVLKLEYDPKLFNIANIDLAEKLQQWDTTTRFPALGKAVINLTGDTALSSGEQELIEITAAISDITYGMSQVIKITDTSINDDALTSVGDAAIHHIALPGEVSADIDYSSTDSYLISKFSTGLNDNFTAYSAIDPFLFADLNGDGVISALDAYLANKLEILDTIAPTVALANQINTDDTVIELAFKELVTQQAANLDNYTLTNSEGEKIEISSITRFNSKRIKLETASPLAAGNYQLNFSEAITDLVGNEIEENQLIDIVVASESIKITPTNGEEMVTLTRETTVHFGKQVDPNTVTSESFYAIANGEKIPGRIIVSSTEEFANLFYDEPLPQSTEVRVVVDGDSIIGRDGVALDGDNDGTPGGIATSDFRTLPLSRIEGTDVFGYVYDSYNRGEDGANIPLQGVKITLDSLPDVFAVTDENGYFILEDVPAPDFYVYIDGSEVVNAPEGRQYASLGKAFHSVPGQAIQLEMDGSAFDIYLPTMAEDDVVGLSDSENTEVGFGAASLDFLEREFPDVDPEIWQQTQVTFAPNAAIDEQGNAATQGMIVPVNPERLPAPLPPNIDPGLVISIQAGSDQGFNRETEGGATNFDIPAPVTFPNLEGLAPGEKSVIWSFDHDAGDWTIIGTGTVSEDGTSIVSDEGVGIIAPGWHFASPPLNSAGSGGEPEGNDPIDEESEPEIFQNLYSTSENNELSFTFEPPPGKKTQPGRLPEGETEPTRVITMTVEGQLSDYYKAKESGGVRSHTWTLKPGDSPLTVSSIQKSLTELKNDLNGGKVFEENILYGSKIEIEEVLTLADGSRQKSTRIEFPYMLIDATDIDKDDLELQFAQTINDGNDNVFRTLPLKIRASDSSTPTLSLTNSSHYYYNFFTDSVSFNPTDSTFLTSAIEIKNPLDEGLAGNINLEGKGVDKQGWRLDATSFETIVKAIAEDTAGTRFPGITAQQRALLNTKAQRDAILASIAEQTATLYDRAGLTPGIFQANRDGSNVINTTFINDGRANLAFAKNALEPADIGLADIVDVYTNRNNYSQLERGYRAAQQINKQLAAEIKVRPYNFFKSNIVKTNSEIKFAMGKSHAHEIGHHLGLFHVNKSDTDILKGGENDVMQTGLFITDNLNFTLTKEAAQLALHINWTGDESDKAIAYYAAYQAKAKGEVFDIRDIVANSIDENVEPDLGLFPDPLLGLFSEDGRLIANTFDLGTVLADGEGGEAIETFWLLSNLGADNLTLTDVNFSENDSVIQLTPDLAGNVLNEANELAQLDISFDPTEAGEFARDVTIVADNGEEYTITVVGTAIDPDPVFDISLLEENNNLGGVAVGQSQTNELLTITNNGAADLTFTPNLIQGNADFDLGAFEGVEQTLAPEESLVIPVTFSPTATRLLSGNIQFTTNDPDLATFNQGIVGTGIPDGLIEFDWGNDFVVIEHDGFIQRTTSNDDGNFGFEIPTFTEYEISIFDPESGLIATGGGFTGATSAFTDLTTSLAFLPSKASDQDFDGLPDDIEFAVGTDINKADTDEDGIDDAVEIEQGLDPLGGRGFPTGIIASLPLRGEAQAVTVAGSVDDVREQTAYVATGSHGLAIVDVSQFDQPIILGQLDLAGNAVDVAVDSSLAIAAIATQSEGLQLVDISDPMLPTLIQTIDLETNKVEVADGVAYVTVGTSLKSIDLFTGEEIHSIALSGSGTVTDLAIKETELYSYIQDVDTDVFAIADIGNVGSLNILGTTNIAVNSAATGISVDNDVAYLVGNGLRTIDISDPTEPSLIKDADNFFVANDISLNGSGLGLIAAEDQGLAIYNISDAEDTDNFLTLFDTPGSTKDAAIASGIAYVADGNGGLQVINYLGFDNQGVAPTVDIEIDSDLDADTAGIQVLAGSSVPIEVNVRDDVQVRNVELLVNDNVVANDVSFPFDLSAIALTEEPEDTTVKVQIRATDTGGNTTLSNVITLNTIVDSFAPIVTSTTPPANSTRREINGITIRFDEAINPALVDIDGIILTNLGTDNAIGGEDDSQLTLQNVQVSQSGRTLLISSPEEAEFTPGSYQLSLDSSIISDRAGNTLESAFTLNVTKGTPSDSLTFGNIINDTFLTEDEDPIYSFTGTEGQKIYFDGISGSSAVDAELLDPSGESLFELQDVNSDRGILTLNQNGTYQLILSTNSNQDEDYSFRLLDPAENQLTLDSLVTGSLTPDTAIEFFSFTAQEEERFYLDGEAIVASDVYLGDAYLIYDPNDQFISSIEFDREFTATADGTYFVAVKSSSEEAINYGFTLITPETSIDSLALGDTITGNINEPGAEDIYTFDASAGQTLYFDGILGLNNSDNRGGFDTQVELISPTQQSIFSSFFVGSDIAPVTLTEDGAYQLKVDGRLAETRDYSFRLLDLAEATQLTLDEVTTGTLDPGNSADLFTFEATVGEQFYFDGQGGTFDGKYAIYSPTNQFVTNSFSNGDRKFTTTTEGTYLIALQNSPAEGSSREAVDYSFELITPETTITEMNIGETVTGRIDELGEEDIYTLELNTGQTIYFDGLIGVDDDGGSEIEASLISPTGQRVLLGTTARDLGVKIVTESGIYQLKVSNNDSARTGNYSFRILDLAQATPISLDTVVTGTLQLGSNSELFTFAANTGDRFSFAGLKADSNAQYSIYDPENRLVLNASRDFIREFTTAIDGTYLVAVGEKVAESIDDIDPIDYSFELTSV